MIKKALKILLKSVLTLLGLICSYLIVAFVLSVIPDQPEKEYENLTHTIYVKSNGVHTDVVLITKELQANIKKSLNQDLSKYTAFGWGDKGFYIEIPTWDDLTFGVAFKAMFLSSETAMHVTPYQGIGKHWKKVKVSDEQLNNLQNYIYDSFQLKKGVFDKIDFKGYTPTDAFYEAKGSYHLFKTCNVWTNQALKVTDVKTGLWSPMDWGILRHLE